MLGSGFQAGPGSRRHVRTVLRIGHMEALLRIIYRAINFRFCIGLIIMLLASVSTAGTAFGVYDARTLGMGGAAVASADTSNAQFYNAALLAFNEEIEERTRDSRLLLPLLSPQLSKSAFDVEEIIGEDLGQDLSRAVDGFNLAPGAESAQAVIDASARLDRAVTRIDDEDVFGDVYAGFAITEPGKHQGAAFFLGVRLIGGGAAEVSDEDLALLDDYQEGLLFVASNGAQGSAQPQLFDANGALLDPVDSITSTSEATGVAITELGVSIAQQTRLFGHDVAAGVSFKMTDVRVFEDVERLIDDRIDIDSNEESKVRFNLDAGLAKDFGDRWRVGLAVKDIIPYSYETSLGTSVKLRPRPRLGVAYQAGRVQIAADADLIANEPLGNERETQEAAVGAEWAPTDLIRLRAGFRADLRGSRNSFASAGAGFVWQRLAIDIAYAEGSDLRAGALQFGLVF